MMKYYYILIALLTIAVASLAIIGYIYLNTGQQPEKCAEGSVFSQEECTCVSDSAGCKGLDKDACDQNPDCAYFTRGGTCYCPSCEISTGQCLPR